MNVPIPSPRPPRPSVLGAVPLVGWMLAAAATVAGCGGSPAPAKGGAGLDPLAAAEADLAAAEARLGRFGTKSAEVAPSKPLGEGGVDPGAATHEPPRPSPPPPAGLEAQGAEPEDTSADSCESACEALSAMRKAADRVCELAPGERCDAARARVADAEKRVTEACSECEG